MDHATGKTNTETMNGTSFCCVQSLELDKLDTATKHKPFVVHRQRNNVAREIMRGYGVIFAGRGQSFYKIN